MHFRNYSGIKAAKISNIEKIKSRPRSQRVRFEQVSQCSIHLKSIPRDIKTNKRSKSQ
jgi:hypothetical protein